jgi:hypothetical protein
VHIQNTGFCFIAYRKDGSKGASGFPDNMVEVPAMAMVTAAILSRPCVALPAITAGQSTFTHLEEPWHFVPSAFNGRMTCA